MYCQFFGRYYYTAIYPRAFFAKATNFLVDPYYEVLPNLMIIMYSYFVVSLSTIVLNSRDRQGNTWLPLKTHLDKYVAL